MTRTLLDGIHTKADTDIKAIKAVNPDLVGGYTNGLYAWTSSDWGLFAVSKYVEISVFASSNTGDVLDCETGDATPAQCPGWIQMRKKAGLYRPTIYCNRSTMAAVVKACLAEKLVLQVDYDVWIADWTYEPHEVPGAAAVQWTDGAHFNLNYDQSAVYDAEWPHRTAPSPGPSPETLKKIAEHQHIIDAIVALSTEAIQLRHNHPKVATAADLSAVISALAKQEKFFRASLAKLEAE